MCDEVRTFCRGCAFCRRAGHGGIRPRMSRRAGDCRSSFSTRAIMSLTTRPTARSMKHTARRTPRVSRASRSTKPITRDWRTYTPGFTMSCPGLGIRIMTKAATDPGIARPATMLRPTPTGIDPTHPFVTHTSTVGPCTTGASSTTHLTEDVGPARRKCARARSAQPLKVSGGLTPPS